MFRRNNWESRSRLVYGFAERLFQELGHLLAGATAFDSSWEAAC